MTVPSPLSLWLLIGWTMLHYLWLGAIFAAAAWIGRRCLSSQPASTRYLYALGCFAVLALMPPVIAQDVVRSAPVNVGPNGRTAGVERGGAIDVGSERPPVFATDAARPSAAEPSASAAETRHGHVDRGTHVPRSPQNGTSRAAETGRQRPLDFRSMTSRLAWLLPWVWCCGAPLTFILTVTGLAGAERLRRQSRLLPEGDRLMEGCRRLAKTLGVRRPLAVGVCDRLSAPVLVGILRPLILLPPAAMTGWTADQVEMALLHELAHVRRWDNLVNLVQRMVESLLFFHPAVWMASGWVRLEREHCCDRIVVARTGRPETYAAWLVSLAAHRPATLQTVFSAAGPMNASSPMAQHALVARVRHILKQEKETMHVSRKLLYATAVPLILAFASAVGFSHWTAGRIHEGDESGAQYGRLVAPFPMDDRPELALLPDDEPMIADTKSADGEKQDKTANDAAQADDAAGVTTKIRGRGPADADDAAQADDAAPVRLEKCRISLINKVTLSSERVGTLEFVVAAGDVVKAGTRLAHLRSDQMEQFEAAYRTAEVQLDQAQAEYEAARKAREAAKDADRAEMDAVVRKLQLGVRIARARFEAAVKQFDHYRRQFAAPFDGLVTRVHKAKGETVTPGQPVVELVSTKRMRVEGMMSVPDALRVRPGDRVEVKLATRMTWLLRDGQIAPGMKQLLEAEKQVLEGRVTFIDPMFDPVARKTRVYAEVDNRDDILRAGLEATMTIFPDERESRQ